LDLKKNKKYTSMTKANMGLKWKDGKDISAN
jgi:hypothetical protein